jgi:hypothetical protein
VAYNCLLWQPQGHKKGTYIANLTPGNALEQLIEPRIKIKDLIGTDPPPVLDNGAQLCLSFLVHQGCWSMCHHANMHAVQLNANEKLQATNYLRTQAHKLKTAAAAATPGQYPLMVQRVQIG